MDAAVSGLERDTSSKCLGVRQTRLVLNGGSVHSVRDGLVPRSLVASVSNGHLRSHAQARPESIAERVDQAGVAGIPERIPARKGPNRQILADHRAESRRDQDVKPRSEPALNAAQLGWRDAGGRCDFRECQSGAEPSGADLVAEVCEQAPAATGATRRVRLRHRHILIERAHQPINRTATIAP